MSKRLIVALAMAGLVGCGGSDGGMPAGDLGELPDEPGAAPSDPGAEPGDPGDATPPSGGGSDPSPAVPTDPTEDPADPVMDPTAGMDEDPAAPVSDDCKGFEVVGLEYSPGGDVLPNTCEPFHTSKNNPYAIRCIDADPSYDTGWPGDESCILPPHPDMGTQIRVGPEDYENPDPRFVMTPSQEFNDYYYTNSHNAEQHYFYRVNLRMRAGSHHMINRMLGEDREDGWSTVGDIGVGFGGGGGASDGFPGAQRPDQDRPNGTLMVPPENAGQGQIIKANQQFSFNLHHFNLTEGETLREVWVNVWYKPEEEVTEEIGRIAIFGNPADLNIAPGEHRELHYRCDVPGNTRITTLNGHRHAWTDRFGVWLVRGDGSTESVYESFDYNDMPTYSYDSITENPAPDASLGKDGAYTGILEVGPGDQLHFVCDITNGSNQTLRFANEVLTGEMCILFGSMVGDSLCGLATRVQ